MPEMPDDELRNAVHAIVSRLQSDMEAQLAQLEQRHQAASETLRRETEARTQAQAAELAAREWSARLEQVRSDSEARLRAELAEAAAAADQRLASETARLLVQAEQAANELAIRHHQEREQAILEATGRIREQVAQERERAQQETQARVQELERLVREHEQSALELAQSFQDLERQSRDREQAAAEASARLRAEIDQANQRVEAAAQNAAQLDAAAGAARKQQEEHQAALEAEREKWTAAVEAERQKLAALSASLDEAHAALTAEKTAREAAQAAAAALEASQQLAIEEQAVGARVEERQAKIALVEQLMTAVRSVSDARSLSDTLNALAAAASTLAPRVALFIVNERAASRELQGWRATGFGDPSPALLHLPADDGGLLATALSSRAPIATSTVSAPDFAALAAERAGLAVPLTVGGKTVAVLYADDGVTGDPEAPASWPEAMQILGAHASVCLSHITAVRTTQAMRSTMSGTGRAGEAPSEEDHSARRYARLLVSEIKLYNEAAVRTGREKRDLLARLGPEIERARRLYEERIPASIAARAKYFQEELVHTLADGDAALLGSV
jgi:chemotaxis protein histidine kinase CheA